MSIDTYELKERFLDLRFNVGMALRYHKMRQWWYGIVNTWVNFGAFALATSAIAALIATAGQTWSAVTIAAATILGLFAQVTRLVEKEYSHRNFAEQLGDMLQELSTALALERYDESDLARLLSRFELLRSSAPDTLRLLTDRCWNEMINEMKMDSDECVPISWLRRVTAHFGDFGYEPPSGREPSSSKELISVLKESLREPKQSIPAIPASTSSNKLN